MAKINKDDLKIGVTFTPCKECDRVDVVRCEKCSFYEKVEYSHPTDKNPTKDVCRLLKRQMQPDDYCSYGERRCEE